MLDYVTSLLLFGAIYSLLALGLNLQWGHTGLINLEFVGFFAIGAYVAAWLTIQSVPFVVATVAALVVPSLAAYPLGRLTLRLQDDYLAVVTLGFAEVVRIVLLNSPAVGGPNGLTGIDPLFGGIPGSIRPQVQLLAVIAVVGVVLLLLRRLTESPYGRVLRAIRDNQVAAQSLGKPTENYRIVALMLGSGVAGLAGSIYAHYIAFISPDQFTSSLTFLVFTGVVVGGSAHLGAAVGSVVFIAAMEATKFVGRPRLAD